MDSDNAETKFSTEHILRTLLAFYGSENAACEYHLQNVIICCTLVCALLYGSTKLYFNALDMLDGERERWNEKYHREMDRWKE